MSRVVASDVVGEAEIHLLRGGLVLRSVVQHDVQVVGGDEVAQLVGEEVEAQRRSGRCGIGVGSRTAVRSE